jgi:hypothetical protein
MTVDTASTDIADARATAIAMAKHTAINLLCPLSIAVCTKNGCALAPKIGNVKPIQLAKKAFVYNHPKALSASVTLVMPYTDAAMA